MLSRPMLFCGVLLASVLGPYVVLNEQLADTARGQWQRLTSFGNPAEDDEVGADRRLDPTQSAYSGTAAPGATIEEVFRFGISPQWVSRRWSRVSMVHGDLDYLGMRVAWVSGTRHDDVAGSLTYYFDQHHQLQRITFTGLAIESGRLLAAVVPGHRLKSQPTTEAAYYIAGDPKNPSSEILVKHLPTIAADPQAPRVEVTVDLRRGDALPSGAANAEADGESRFLPSSYRRW